MQFWNPPRDLSGTFFFFEGPYAPLTAPEGAMLDLLHNGVTLPPSAPLNPSLSSLCRSRDTGGELSGIELLAYHDSRGAPVEKVVPSLFIQRDA